MANDYIDPVLGTPIIPNILDDFDNVSYNLKLYMIPFEYWKNNKKTAPPAETIVIAQTSVTGVQIDNLTLDFVMDKQGLGTSVSASFQLIQPGAADLLDQIMAARMATGHNMYSDAPVFLEIVFQGYTSDIDDPEGGGVPTTISGPYRYKLHLTTIEISIDSTGSVYDVSAAVGSSVAHTDEYFKIPKDMSLRGRNIEDFVMDLQNKLKQYREENLPEEMVHDIIEFDMSQVKQVLGDLDLSYQAAENAEQINRLINAQQMGISTREEFEKILEDDPTSLDGGVTADRNFLRQSVINMTEKSSLQQFFTTLLSMNDSFLDKVSRKKVFNDPEIDQNGLDLNKTFTKWYKLEASVVYQDYDIRRNRYAKKIVWKPVIYNTASENNIVSLAETDLSEDNVTNRVQDLGIMKAYHYLFTGINDQILKADISYKNGHTLLMAPKGGKMGNFSSNDNPMSPSIKQSADLSGKTANAKIDAKTKERSIASIAEDIANDPGSINDLAARLGKDDEWVKEVANNAERRNRLAQAIVYLNSEGQNPLTTYNTAQYGGDGTTPMSILETQSRIGQLVAYRPEPSGFTYAVDLLDDIGGSETVIGSTVAASSEREAWKVLTEAAKETIDTNGKSRVDYSTHVVPQGASTEDGSYSATLFGYMYNNANHADILVNLNLQIRGDPWYLGKPDTNDGDNVDKPASEMEDSSDPDYIVNEQSDNYYLFNMQTPRVIDPDLDDEDFNTGYMSRTGTSFFISGVYAIYAYSTNFSSGMFDVEFTKSPKLTSLSLAKYKKPDTSTE